MKQIGATPTMNAKHSRLKWLYIQHFDNRFNQLVNRLAAVGVALNRIKGLVVSNSESHLIGHMRIELMSRDRDTMQMALKELVRHSVAQSVQKEERYIIKQRI